jgi:carbonic anhydrase
VLKVKGHSGDFVENAVVANVQYQVATLKQTSTILTQLMEAGKLKL